MKLSLVLWLALTKNSNITGSPNKNSQNLKFVPLMRQDKWLKRRLIWSNKSNLNYVTMNKLCLVEKRTNYNLFFILHIQYSLTTLSNKNTSLQNWSLFKSNPLNFIGTFHALNTFLWPAIKEIYFQILIIQVSMISLKLLKEPNFKTLSSTNTKIPHFTPTTLQFLTLIRLKDL